MRTLIVSAFLTTCLALVAFQAMPTMARRSLFTSDVSQAESPLKSFQQQHQSRRYINFGHQGRQGGIDIGARALSTSGDSRRTRRSKTNARALALRRHSRSSEALSRLKRQVISFGGDFGSSQKSELPLVSQSKTNADPCLCNKLLKHSAQSKPVTHTLKADLAKQKLEAKSEEEDASPVATTSARADSSGSVLPLLASPLVDAMEGDSSGSVQAELPSNDEFNLEDVELEEAEVSASDESPLEGKSEFESFVLPPKPKTSSTLNARPKVSASLSGSGFNTELSSDALNPESTSGSFDSEALADSVAATGLTVTSGRKHLPQTNQPEFGSVLSNSRDRPLSVDPKLVVDGEPEILESKQGVPVEAVEIVKEKDEIDVKEEKKDPLGNILEKKGEEAVDLLSGNKEKLIEDIVDEKEDLLKKKKKEKEIIIEKKKIVEIIEKPTYDIYPPLKPNYPPPIGPTYPSHSAPIYHQTHPLPYKQPNHGAIPLQAPQPLSYPLYKPQPPEVVVPPKKCLLKIKELDIILKELLLLSEKLKERLLIDIKIGHQTREVLLKKLAMVQSSAEQARVAAELFDIKTLTIKARIAGLELSRLSTNEVARKLEPGLRQFANKMRRAFAEYRKVCIIKEEPNKRVLRPQPNWG